MRQQFQLKLNSFHINTFFKYLPNLLNKSQVVNCYPSNMKIKSLIGQLLSNISQHQECQSAILRTGWVGTLASWRQSSKLEVSLPADKCLANLDVKFGVHTYSPGIYLLAPSDR